jgi:hypothetical protein
VKKSNYTTFLEMINDNGKGAYIGIIILLKNHDKCTFKILLGDLKDLTT